MEGVSRGRDDAPAAGSYAALVESFAAEWEPTSTDPFGSAPIAKLWLDCSHPVLSRSSDHIAQVTWHRNGSRRIRFGRDRKDCIYLDPRRPGLASAPITGLKGSPRDMWARNPDAWTVTPPDPTAAPNSGTAWSAYIIRCPGYERPSGVVRRQHCDVVFARNFMDFWKILDAARHAGLTRLNVPELT